MSEMNLEEKLCKNLEDSCIKAYKAGQQSMQAEINQHQLEIHALGKANLNQAMMLAKKQEEIDSLKAQLNNMEACYIGKKKECEELQVQIKGWKAQSMVAIIHGTCSCGEPWQSIVSDKEGFNCLHCFNCNHDRYENKEFFGDHEPKILRGAND